MAIDIRLNAQNASGDSHPKVKKSHMKKAVAIVSMNVICASKIAETYDGWRNTCGKFTPENGSHAKYVELVLSGKMVSNNT